MFRRALAVCLCLLFTAFPALAAGGNATLFEREGEVPTLIYSLCAHEGALYIVAEDGFYAYRDGDEAPARVSDYEGCAYEADETGAPGPDAAPSPEYLFSRDGQLYGLSTACARFGKVKIGAALTLTETVDLRWQELLIDEYSNFYSAMLDGDALYCSVDEFDYRDRALLYVDTQTGAARKLEGAAHFCAAPYRPGSVLLLTRQGHDQPPQIARYDVQSGACEALYAFARPDDYPSGLAYDAESDTIYWALSGALWALRPGEAPAEVNYFPGGTSNLASALLWDGRYACIGEDGVLVRATDPAQKPARVLRIAGFSDSLLVNRFAAQHPEIAVACVSQPALDVATAMLGGASEVDIYRLSVRSSAYRVMRERGYLYDLSASEIVRATLAQMPENFVGPLRQGEKLLAVPCELSSGNLESCWAYSPEVLTRLGLAPEQLPQTWLQFLQFIEAWPQTFGASFPNLAPFGDTIRYNGGIKQRLFLAFLDSYLAECARAGRTPSLDAPEFRAVADALRRIDASQYEFDDGERAAWEEHFGFDDQGFAHHGLFECGYGKLFLEESMDQDMIVYELLPLAAWEGAAPVYPADMSVLVVNPYSQNTDLAVQFLEEFCQGYQGALKRNMLSGFDEPLEDAYYVAQVPQIRGQIEETEALLASCAEAERQQVWATLDELRRELREAEAWRESITRQNIADYRARQGGICFEGATALAGEEGGDFQALIRRYREGEIDTEALIAKLGQMLQMMRMEGH